MRFSNRTAIITGAGGGLGKAYAKAILSEGGNVVIAEFDDVKGKSTEKEFKLFAQKRSVLSEKIDVLKHQLENVKSPEYLLSLERKKFLENEAKQKQLDKESKLLNKQKEDEKKAKESDKKKKK